MEYKPVKGIDYTGIGICFLCVNKEGQLLMHQRSDKCRDEHWRWDCGGGGVKHGETIEKALLRELNEELGITPLEYKLLGYRETFRELNGKKNHWITFDFKVLVDPQTVHIREPDMIVDIGWFTLTKLPSPLHSLVLPTIDKNRPHLLV